MDLGHMCTALAKEQASLNTRLLQAIARGDHINMVAVERLLAARADPNCRCEEDRSTALHLAVARISVDVDAKLISALVQAGADPSGENAAGETPWRAAAKDGNAPGSAAQIEMLRLATRVVSVGQFPPCPKSVQAFLKNLSLSPYSDKVAVWCHFQGATTVHEFLAAPQEHFEAMGLSATAIRRVAEARKRLETT